ALGEQAVVVERAAAVKAVGHRSGPCAAVVHDSRGVGANRSISVPENGSTIVERAQEGLGGKCAAADVKGSPDVGGTGCQHDAGAPVAVVDRERSGSTKIAAGLRKR